MKKKGVFWDLTVLLSVMAFLTGSEAFAGGPVHGAKAAGMGTAFIAVADDPSAIMFNPAGLTQLKGTQVYGGGTALLLDSEFENTAGKEETEFQLFFPPHLYIASPVGSGDWVLGLGFDSPLGLGGRRWESEGILRYGSTESAISTAEINPTVAWRVTPWLSVAAGVDYLWAVTQTERMVDQSLLGAGDGAFRLEGDGDGWGWNAGVLLHAGEKVRLGFAYRSGIEVDVEGKAKLKRIAPPLQPLLGGDRFETDVKTSQDYPEIYGFGVALAPDARWTLALDVEWVRWSSFGAMKVDFKREIPEAGIVDGRIRQDWDDSLQVKIGADYRLNDAVSLRGGYGYIPTPVPDATLEPGNPDADQHNLSAGVGVQKGAWVVDGFYNVGFLEKRTVRNEVVAGTFDSTIHYLGLSVGKTF